MLRKRNHLDHCITFYSILLLLLRLDLFHIQFFIQFRGPHGSWLPSRHLHRMKGIWSQMHLFVVGTCKSCLDLLGGKETLSISLTVYLYIYNLIFSWHKYCTCKSTNGTVSWMADCTCNSFLYWTSYRKSYQRKLSLTSEIMPYSNHRFSALRHLWTTVIKDGVQGRVTFHPKSDRHTENSLRMH